MQLNADTIVDAIPKKSLQVVDSQPHSWLEDMKLSVVIPDQAHMSEGDRRLLRLILKIFDRMLNGFLRKINVTFHCIDLSAEACPVTQRPHRAGLKARESDAEEIAQKSKT